MKAEAFFGKRGGGNRIGSQLFNEKVMIYSDPSDGDVPSSPIFTDGRPQSKVIWVENGVLKALPYTRYWAAQKNVDTLLPPENFIRRSSGQSLEDLIKGTGKAVLVTRFYYIGLVDPQTLVFTKLTRDGTFAIENGEIKNAVKNFRFNESPAAMLSNLEAVGKSIRISDSMIPSMRIKDFNFTSLSDSV